MDCLKCNSNISSLVGFETLCDDFIVCPECGHKMTVEYNETWDGENEEGWFWVEDYKEDE
jgi:transcription elongation factor Elf1